MGFEHWEVGFQKKKGLGNGTGTPSSGPSARSAQQDQEDNRRQAFFAAEPTLWNALPHELRALGSLKTFMARLKTHYFKLAFSL